MQVISYDVCLSLIYFISMTISRSIHVAAYAMISFFLWLSSIPFGEGNGTPLQYSCLENSMDGGAWQAAVHEVAKSQTRLNDFTFAFHFHALEKQMVTHSSVLAWRSPGTGSLVGCRLWGRTESDTTERLSRIPLDICTTSSLSIPLSMDTYVTSVSCKQCYNEH